MKTTAKRLGASVVAPQTGRDSSHGSAMVTPAPRRNIRRDGCDLLMLLTFRGRALFEHATGPKLRTSNDRVDQGLETIVVGGELAAEFFEGRLVGEDQAAAEGIGEQFAAEVVDEIVPAMLADEGAEALEALAFAAAGKLGPGVDRAAGEIFGALFAHGSIAFE